MHILLTNDDGIYALGIQELAKALPEEWRITIIAPHRERSAHSHMLTVGKELQLMEIPSEYENVRQYAFSGTPADCAKFALEFHLKDDKPDLLISGINSGYNLGSDVLYSGTVSAAMEGLFYGVPALALSVKKYSSERGSEIIPFVIEIIHHIFAMQGFKGCLNVNFPLHGECDWSQVRVAPQGLQRYANVISWEGEKEGTFFLAGHIVEDEIEEGTDTDLVRHGFITMTALTWQQVHEKEQQEMINVVQQLQIIG